MVTEQSSWWQQSWFSKNNDLNEQATPLTTRTSQIITKHWICFNQEFAEDSLYTVLAKSMTTLWSEQTLFVCFLKQPTEVNLCQLKLQGSTLSWRVSKYISDMACCEAEEMNGSDNIISIEWRPLRFSTVDWLIDTHLYLVWWIKIHPMQWKCQIDEFLLPMKAPFEVCLQQQTAVISATAACIPFKSITQFKSMQSKVLSLLIYLNQTLVLTVYLIFFDGCAHLVELATCIQKVATV